MILQVTAVIVLLSLVGCSAVTDKEEKVAYITANSNSEYENVFKDLGLGILYDFNLKLPHADESWVHIWVEGYSNGQKMEPFHLIDLNYGESPEPTNEGHMGFGFINPRSEDASLFLYSNSVKAPPTKLNNLMVDLSSMASSWGYSIGDEEIGLNSGETKLLAVYRATKDNKIRTYDYQDIQSIDEMIKNHSFVLLLKIKVVKT